MVHSKKATGYANTQAASKSFSDCNYSKFEAIEIFRAAMVDAGIIINESINADGTLHRVHVEGDKRSTKNGGKCSN